ncbi:hypothetical protein EDC01DRAFT_635536 [Geopyxis carbonaria]|nr:hypothetical protein EDC01DRAFT_635536 [Geopyxis carbonaria]
MLPFSAYPNSPPPMAPRYTYPRNHNRQLQFTSMPPDATCSIRSVNIENPPPPFRPIHHHLAPSAPPCPRLSPPSQPPSPAPATQPQGTLHSPTAPPHSPNVRPTAGAAGRPVAPRVSSASRYPACSTPTLARTRRNTLPGPATRPPRIPNRTRYPPRMHAEEVEGWEEGGIGRGKGYYCMQDSARRRGRRKRRRRRRQGLLHARSRSSRSAGADGMRWLEADG